MGRAQRSEESGTEAPTGIKRALSEHLRLRPDLLPTGSRVLVALSGGPDSTALIHLLAQLSRSHDWDIQAAHYVHGIRPGGDGETGLLASRMRSLGVALHLGRPVDPLRPAQAPMRQARYAWLKATAAEIGADRIATGHNQDDQVETVLFRLMRGTGNRGLAGIPARRGSIVRPLLALSAADIRSWLGRAGIEAFDDPSNRDPRWARNRVRHQLLPALEEHTGPDARRRLLAIQSAAELVEAASNKVVKATLDAATGDDADVLDRRAVLAWPPPLLAEILRYACRVRGVRLTRGAALGAATGIESLGSGQGLDLGGTLRIERSFDRLVFRAVAAHPRESGRLSIRPGRTGESTLRLLTSEFRVRWRPGGASTGAEGSVALSVPRDHYPLTVRGWEAGDRIRLPAGSRKLKRVFGEARVPAPARHSIPIVTDRWGGVLWISGVARGVMERTAHNQELVIEIEDA